MRDIEIEEGEAYFVRDDDDENIDLDRDLSYIDRKLENYLGHYQKDFMRGFSADSMGPIFGGYGSFLPVQERSPPILLNQSSQSHVSSKSPPNLSSQHFSQKPVVDANTSLPARTVPVSSNQRQPVQLQSESGIFTQNNQLKVKSSAECASNHHQQPNKPVPHHFEQKSLKLTLASASVLSRDNSALYSGLGLDMSPSSSPEGTPLEKDGTLPGLEEMNLESPSFIVQIMTSIPLPNEALISPLHDDLICLMELENTLETGLPGIGQAEPLNITHDSAYLDGKKDIDKKKPKLKDTAKEINSKQKEASKEMKLKQNTIMQKPAVLVNEDCKISESTPSTVLDKKSDVGCLVAELDDCTKQGQGRCNVKVEFGSVLSDAPVVKKGSTIKITRKTGKVKNVIAIPKDEPGTEQKNELGCSEDEANKILKQHIVVKKLKESVKHEKMAKDKEVSVVSEKDVEDDNKHYDIPLEIKHDEPESSKQKPCAQTLPRLKMRPGLKEPSSSLVKKNFKDLQAGNASFAEPPRGSIVSSSGAETEVIRKNIPRSGIDLTREMRKDSEVTVVKNPSKKGKEVSARRDVMRATEREAQQSASKMKERLSSNKTGFAYSGPNLGGDVVNVNCLLPPPENASLVPSEMDNWVECEKCQKWRLLPFGTNPDSLPKEWICRMLTWLPGMNRCSVSEDETTHALRALYIPSALGPALLGQNDQEAHVDGIASVKPLAGAQNDGLFNPSIGSDGLSRGKKQNFKKLEIHGASQSGAQDLHRSIKKDPQHSGGNNSLKILKKIPQETACAGKNAAAAGRPLKILKKRMAEAEVSGVPKKLKKVHQQSMVSAGHAGPPELKGESKKCDPDAFRSSECPPQKVKNRGRITMAAMDDEVSDAFERKQKKLNDQQRSAGAAEPFGNGQRPLSNLVTGKNSGKNSFTERRKEQKTNTLNIEARESSADKGHHRTKGDGRKHNLSRVDDNNTHQGCRAGGTILEPYHTDRVSGKIADAKKSSEKVPDSGLPHNVTTSSSSKISIKVKVKAREVRGSPAGSISSSPLKVCKSDPDKGTKRIAVSYNEPEELSSEKRRKSRAEGACSSNDFAPLNEEMKDRKSNLSRTACMMSDAAHEDQFSKKVSYGRHSTVHRVDAQPKREEFECHNGKRNHRHHGEGTVASQQKPESQLPNGSQFDNITSLDKQKLRAGDMESSFHSSCVPGCEKGSVSNSVRVDNGSEKLSRHVSDDSVNLRHSHHTANASQDIGPSSSVEKDSFQWAVTALEEARFLKHSANCLKTSGSGVSTGIFFQAALKFLHGASLLEPGNNENGRIGEMSSTEVYSSTAKLCEYCAHEYEKCNDMASAALAYKCMEVAYMRVVYSSDVTASRDRVELQMAVQDAPQVESPSSSASDIDNLNNQVAVDSGRDVHSMMDHRNHVISAGNRTNFMRLLSFTHDMNVAMEASRKSQGAFAVANPILQQAGNEQGISSIKRVLEFSFHDVDSLLDLVRLAMEALNN